MSLFQYEVFCTWKKHVLRSTDKGIVGKGDTATLFPISDYDFILIAFIMFSECFHPSISELRRHIYKQLYVPSC